MRSIHKEQTEVKESFIEVCTLLVHQKEPTFLVEVKLSGQISGNSLKHEVLVRKASVEKALGFQQGKAMVKSSLNRALVPG